MQAHTSEQVVAQSALVSFALQDQHLEINVYVNANLKNKWSIL